MSARSRRQRQEDTVMTSQHLRVLSVHKKTAAKLLSHPPIGVDWDHHKTVVFVLNSTGHISKQLGKLVRAGIAYDHWTGPESARWLSIQHHVRFDKYGELVFTVLHPGSNATSHDNLFRMSISNSMSPEDIRDYAKQQRDHTKIIEWDNQADRGDMYISLQLLVDHDADGPPTFGDLSTLPQGL